jgi:hypothetical protein
MDDPWANAWGEPATTSRHLPAPVLPPSDADDEEDITIPSWEAPVSWTDENSLWGARSPVLDKFPSWQSPYDDIPLGKHSPSPPITLGVPEPPPEDEQHEQESEEVVSETELELAPESPAEPTFEPPIPSPVASPILPPISPPGSPDAFGTFESGLGDFPPTSDPWTPSRAAILPDSADAAWGAGWASSDVEEHEEADAPAVIDEWEAAKQQKDMQDKHVVRPLLYPSSCTQAHVFACSRQSSLHPYFCSLLNSQTTSTRLCRRQLPTPMITGQTATRVYKESTLCACPVTSEKLNKFTSVA